MEVEDFTRTFCSAVVRSRRAGRGPGGSSERPYIRRYVVCAQGTGSANLKEQSLHEPMAEARIPRRYPRTPRSRKGRGPPPRAARQEPGRRGRGERSRPSQRGMARGKTRSWSCPVFLKFRRETTNGPHWCLLALACKSTPACTGLACIDGLAQRRHVCNRQTTEQPMASTPADLPAYQDGRVRL